jgi:hypothetical protein
MKSLNGSLPCERQDGLGYSAYNLSDNASISHCRERQRLAKHLPVILENSSITTSPPKYFSVVHCTHHGGRHGFWLSPEHPPECPLPPKRTHDVQRRQGTDL